MMLTPSFLALRSAHWLVMTVVLLTFLGIVMLFSTCVYSAEASVRGVYFDAHQQLRWFGVGLLLCLVFYAIDYHRLESWKWAIYGLALVVLAACFVPFIGEEINGERRWISAKALGIGVRLQPSEFAKLALVVVLAAWYGKGKVVERKFIRGFVIPGALAAAVLLLIALEVDIGTTAVLAGAVFLLMYIGGASLKHLAVGAVAGIAGFVALILTSPGRMERILAILNPEAYERGVGLQQKMAKLAFGSGGVEGIGLGQGRLKMQYMPFAHTDFIFPMIGEELGLFFTLGVVGGFVAFTVLGLVIAMHAPDRFGKMLGTGIVLCIALQALLNISVTTAVFPNTGLPLPFVSYGGSNLVCSLIGVGCLLNIYRQGRMQVRGEPVLKRDERLTPRL